MSDFQPAKSSAREASVFTNCGKTDRARGKKKGAQQEQKLTRVAFKVSRLMEFCTKRELQNQTGHSVNDWPLVVLKELMDNALDACEEAEVPPVISIRVNTDAGSIIIKDNAGGIATDTIRSVLDYTIRVSSREAYVSPTRGAQGNALKTILAMGYVLDREEVGRNTDAVGVTIIETRGVKHRIEFRVDHINNQPKISHSTTPSPIKVGTKITIKWPPKAELFSLAADDFKELAESYTWFNPHLALRAFWNCEQFINVKATNPNLGEMATTESDQPALV
jgi:DNA topoisomerase VI subunit B